MENTQVINNSLIKEFRSYLKQQGLSAKSRSNYVSDIKHFKSYYPNKDVFIREDIANYVDKLRSINTSIITINRRLSSLRHLGRFLGLDFMEGIGNLHLPKKGGLVGDFEKYLIASGLREKTVRNYKSDVGQFVGWLKANHIEVGSLTSGEIRNYFVRIKEHASSATVKRKISAVRKFVEWRFSLEIDQKPEKKTAKPVVPGIIMAAIVILLIIQVVVGEKIRNPWPDAIASEGQVKFRFEPQSENFSGRQISFKKEGVNVQIEGVGQLNTNTSAELQLEAANRFEESDQVAIGLGRQADKDGFGSAKIEPKGVSVMVRNESVTPYSYIYVTPTSKTDNQTIYIREQGIGFFVAEVENAIDSEIRFNWWLVND